MPPVVVAQSYYSFTPAVCAFLQAKPLQGRKLVIGWITWEVRKALLDFVELWRKSFPPYSLCLSQSLPTVSYCSMSIALRLVAHRLPHTAWCVCAHSAPESQHSGILFSQIRELQNPIFLGSRSWQKCKCNIPDGENLHADSMYAWGSFHCAALFCPATAAVCLDKTFWYSTLTAWVRLWHTGRSTLSCAHKTACVRARTQWRWTQNTVTLPSLIVMTFRRLSSRRWLQSSETFACLAWNEYLSCSANSKSSSTLAQGVTLVRKPRLTASRCSTSNGVSLQKRRPKASTDDRPKHSKLLFSFR